MASTAFYLCPSWDRSWFLACWHLWRVGLSTSLAWAGLGGFCTATAVGNRSEHQSQAGRMEAAGGQGLLRGPRNLGCDPGWLAWHETPFSQTGGPASAGESCSHRERAVGAGSSGPRACRTSSSLGLQCPGAPGPCLGLHLGLGRPCLFFPCPLYQLPALARPAEHEGVPSGREGPAGLDYRSLWSGVS